MIVSGFEQAKGVLTGFVFGAQKPLLWLEVLLNAPVGERCEEEQQYP